MKFDTAMLTDNGMVRKSNEDSCLAIETNRSQNSVAISYGLYLVADGMGGHQAGEIASAKAVEIISRSVIDMIDSPDTDTNTSQTLLQITKKANTEIYNMATNNTDYAGMGTTATFGLRVDDRLYLAHVGDSRAYLIRGKTITQLTQDHSLVATLVKAGMITKEEARRHPEKNIILRCLGTSPDVSIDTYMETNNKESLLIQTNDTLVFCSDGLTNHILDDEIMTIVQKAKDSHYACQQLVLAANQRGGDDNISVIVVKSNNKELQ